MEAQQAKQANPFPDRLLKNVNDFPKYEDSSHQSGHAALLDWPFKIHGIYNKKKITWELYDLSKDPMETTPLNTQQPQRLAGMQKQLTTWQKSVLSSHAGNDYKKQ
jgi:hypothetical protein